MCKWVCKSDQLDRPVLFILKPWPVRIFEDSPFSLYIVADSESDEGLVSFSVLGVLSSPKKFQWCFKEVLRVFQGSFQWGSMVFERSPEWISGKFQRCFKGIWRKYLGCFEEVSRVFQGCFKEDWRMFQWSFKWVFKRSSMGPFSWKISVEIASFMTFI